QVRANLGLPGFAPILRRIDQITGIENHYRKPLVANSCNRREPMFLVEHDPIAIRGEFPRGQEVKKVAAVLQSTCPAVEVLELNLLVAIQKFYSVPRLP